jgi:hypothetical protein
MEKGSLIFFIKKNISWFWDEYRKIKKKKFRLVILHK